MRWLPLEASGMSPFSMTLLFAVGALIGFSSSSGLINLPDWEVMWPRVAKLLREALPFPGFRLTQRARAKTGFLGPFVLILILNLILNIQQASLTSHKVRVLGFNFNVYEFTVIYPLLSNWGLYYLPYW